MQFEKGYLYHIYNQGNNRQAIFFKRENYLFFLEKIKTFISPYADILAWCLMPNHFHLMVFINEISLAMPKIDTITQSHRINSRLIKQRTFNNSIAIMLRSYTRAINKEQNLSGSLFKAHTKAECINCPKGISPSFITKNGITEITIGNSLKEYPQICFNYIHNNPSKAGIVKLNTDWEFSSARDYAGIRNGKLINKNITEQYVEY